MAFMVTFFQEEYREKLGQWVKRDHAVVMAYEAAIDYLTERGEAGFTDRYSLKGYRFICPSTLVMVEGYRITDEETYSTVEFQVDHI